MMRPVGTAEKTIVATVLTAVVLLATAILCLNLEGTSWTSNSLIQLASICAKAGVMVLLLAIAFYCVINKYYKGIKYGRTYTAIKRSVLRALDDAGYYQSDDAGHKYYPAIRLVMNKDLTHGKVYVRNTPRLDNLLKTFDLSSAIGKYVVDRWYRSDDANYYVYEICDNRELKSKLIRSYDDFRQIAAKADKYMLFVDCKTYIKLQHMLICGATRSGKTYFMYLLLLQIIVKRSVYQLHYHLYFADPKRSTLWIFGNRLGLTHNSYDVDKIISDLKAFHKELEDRQTILAKLQINKLDSDYKDFNLEPYIFVFDEFASFMGVLQTYPKSTRDEVMSCLRDIVLKGAGCGFFIWIIMQKSDSTTIPTMIRDNLTFKLVLGNAEDTTYTTTFGAGANVPVRNYQTGEGVYTDAGVVNTPKAIAIPTLKFDIVTAIARSLNEAGVV